MINIIVHRSAGNAEVGSMWHDSYEFTETTTLAEVIATVKANGAGGEDIIIPGKIIKKGGVREMNNKPKWYYDTPTDIFAATYEEVKE